MSATSSTRHPAAHHGDAHANALNQPQAYTIKSFGDAYGVGRTTIFAEIAAKRLAAVKIGNKTLEYFKDKRLQLKLIISGSTDHVSS